MKESTLEREDAMLPELKECREELQEKEELFHYLLDKLHMIAVGLDPFGNITFTNPFLLQLTGYTEEEVLGKNWFDLFVSPERREEMYRVFREFFGTEMHLRYENPILTKSGEERIVSWNNIRLPGRHGIAGTMSLGEDVTEQRRAERLLRQLSSQLISAQEAERKRVAQELHDVIGSNLAAIKYLLERMIDQMEKHSSSAVSLEEVVSFVQATIEDTRRIMSNLRPSLLDDLGVLPAVNWLCREFQKIYDGIHLTKRIEIREEEIPEMLKIVIFRILQEALNNIAKHSRAQHVSILLRGENGRIELAVQDDGIGFDLREACSQKRGLGLASMSERAEFSGGLFTIHSIPGQGTRVQGSWPLPRLQALS